MPFTRFRALHDAQEPATVLARQQGRGLSDRPLTPKANPSMNTAERAGMDVPSRHAAREPRTDRLH